jgi:hypothetical protein
MSATQREEPAHALAATMRSALARAELAAGRLARDASTPRARRLAHSISAAVAELDRALGDLVELAAGSQRPARDEDLDGVLRALRERHAPVLAARGIDWVDAPQAGSLLRGDGPLARRAVALLLRVGAASAQGGGQIALAASADAEAWSLGIEVNPACDAPRPATEALAELRALASRSHATLDHVHCAGRTTLRLRFPGEAAT